MRNTLITYINYLGYDEKLKWAVILCSGGDFELTFFHRIQDMHGVFRKRTKSQRGIKGSAFSIKVVK